MHRIWSRGGTTRGGGAIEKLRRGESLWDSFTGVIPAADGRKENSASSFVSIILPVVGTTVYRGVARRGTGGGIE